jgi:hypothetical protein
MRLAHLLAIAATLSACGQSNLARQDDDYGGAGEIVDMRPQPTATATVAADAAGEDPIPPELRDIAPIVAPTPSSASRPPAAAARFVDLGSEDGSRSGVSMSVIRDRATGCEYVVTKLYGEDLSAERRTERTPQGQRIQRCVRPTGGSGYVWIGSALPVQVSTVRDTQTGCDYVLGTMFGQASFMLPRMERAGYGDSAPMCRVLERPGQEG